MGAAEIQSGRRTASLPIGLLLGAGGVAMLCSMDAVAKSLGASLPILEIVVFRYAGAALWLAAWIAITRSAWPKRAKFSQHVLRAGIMAATACMFFYAVTHLPLAMAAALAMTAPIYISALGIVFLKEPPRVAIFLALVLGLAGSATIIFTGEPVAMDTPPDIFAWGAAMLAPLAYAGGLVLLKHHADDDGAAAMTLAQSAISALIVLPLAGVFGIVAPPPDLWIRIALIGALGAIGFILLIAGLRRLPASTFATLDYTGLIWAAVFGYLFFGEAVGLRLWIGGGLIIAGCAVSMLDARKPQTNLATPI